jgi:hypothetical protein
MLLGLVACGGSGEEAKPAAQLEIGFGKINITPTYSVGLGGNGTDKNRRSTGLISYLFATCVAAKYGEETILMFTVDTLSISDDLADTLRDAIVADLPEIKPEHIYLAATHCHSAPSPYWSDNSPEGKYRQEFINYMPQAAKAALKDLAPATMEMTSFDLPGMSYVRHYIAEDGSYAGNNYGNQNIAYKEHTYDVDHEMILVNFPREGKEPVMLVNWAAHPANPYDASIGYHNISSDHPGWCRDKLEELTGAKVAYFNGASGDVVPDSRVAELAHHLNAKQYGIKLGELAYAHIGELKAVEVDGITTTGRDVTLNVEHEKEHLVAQCEEIRHLYIDLNDKATADAKAIELGLSSCHHATAIVSRSKLGPTQQREVNGFRIGPMGFITHTYEMSSEHADELKAAVAADYPTVFILAGNNRYLPREEAIDQYTYEGNTRFYTRDAADVMVQNYIEMLGIVK